MKLRRPAHRRWPAVTQLSGDSERLAAAFWLGLSGAAQQNAKTPLMQFASVSCSARRAAISQSNPANDYENQPARRLHWVSNDGQATRIDLQAILPVLPELLGVLHRDVRRNPHRTQSVGQFLMSLLLLPESARVSVAPSITRILLVLARALRVDAGLVAPIAATLANLPPDIKTLVGRALVRGAAAHYTKAVNRHDLPQLAEINRAFWNPSLPADREIEETGHRALEQILTWQLRTSVMRGGCVSVISDAGADIVSRHDDRWEQMINAYRPRVTYRHACQDGPPLELLVRKQSWLYFRSSVRRRATLGTFWLAFFADPYVALDRLTINHKPAGVDEMVDTISKLALVEWRGLGYASVNLLTLGMVIPEYEVQLGPNTWADCIERLSTALRERPAEKTSFGWYEFAYYPLKVLVNNILVWSLVTGQQAICQQCVDVLAATVGMSTNIGPFVRFVV